MSAYGPFADEAAFSAWLAERQTLKDPYYYAALDAERPRARRGDAHGDPPGHARDRGRHIVYSPALQRTPLGTETQYLLARYVFETLGYRRYEWKCDSLNAPSRRAAGRYGFVFEGILRQHMIAKGRNRDTAYFSMLDSEWPARKRNFERWLAPENFDAARPAETQSGSVKWAEGVRKHEQPTGRQGRAGDRRGPGHRPRHRREVRR